jgi:hypothetical protein
MAITISTTILKAYDTCKVLKGAEFCKTEAMNSAPTAVDGFLRSYDACLLVSNPTTCRKLFEYNVPTPPIIPFLLGLGLGWIIKKRK